MFLYLKSLHIIFVVIWFAGLFYIVRLFVYFAETENLSPNEKTLLQNQYRLMQKRLWYGITWPGMIFTLIFGLWMLVQIPAYLTLPWMHLKLAFVAGLMLYHFKCHQIFLQQQKGLIKLSSFKLRIWNELATLFLVSIVFLVVLRDTLSWIWGITGLILFAGILMLAIKLYKNKREKKNQK